MAKEKVHRIPEEEREGMAIALAKQVFVDRTPFVDPLRGAGVVLRDSDPVGVATIQTLQQELELQVDSEKGEQNRDRDNRRAIATAVSGGVRAHSLNGIFPRLSSVGIAVSRLPDGTELMYRTDISPEEAAFRYDVYKAALDEAVALRRAPLQAQRQQKEEAKRKKKTEGKPRPEQEKRANPKVYLVVLGHQRDEKKEVLESRIDLLVGALEEGQRQKGVVPSVKREVFPDPTENIQEKSRILLPTDVRHILEHGISKEALQALFPTVRQQIIAQANFLEASLADTGRDANLLAVEKLDAPEQAVFISIPAKRFAALSLAHNLVAHTSDSRVKVDYHIGNHSYYYMFPSYIDHAIGLWDGRFYTEQLMQHKAALKDNPSETANVFIQMIDDPQRESIFREIVINREVVYNDMHVTIEEIDNLLGPIVLPDEVILRAMWQDVLGGAYPTPYILAGEDRETALVSLRLITEQFAEGEIYNLIAGLEPDPISHQRALGQLEEEVAKREEAVKNLSRKDPDYKRKRQIFDLQLSVAKRSLADMKKDKSITERVVEAVEERVPRVNPNPADYKGGENSLGFKKAMQKYELFKERIPGLMPPSPDDFVMGERSKGYDDDVVLYQGLRTISADGWRAISQEQVKTYASRISDKESILGESVIG